MNRHGKSIETLGRLEPVFEPGQLLPRSWTIYGVVTEGGSPRIRVADQRTGICRDLPVSEVQRLVSIAADWLRAHGEEA